MNVDYILKIMRSHADRDDMPLDTLTVPASAFAFAPGVSVRLVHPISRAVGAEFHVGASMMHDKDAFINAFDSAIRKAERTLYPHVVAHRAAAAKLAATASQYYQFRIGQFSDLSKVRK